DQVLADGTAGAGHVPVRQDRDDAALAAGLVAVDVAVHARVRLADDLERDPLVLAERLPGDAGDGRGFRLLLSHDSTPTIRPGRSSTRSSACTAAPRLPWPWR